ncbi:MAG: DUF5060 domain-containing protein [Hamadaea sp.]|nr:DUF5060 domain-containing protein [Hamadaea sp.]
MTLIVGGPERATRHRMAEFTVDGVREVRNAYNPEEIDLVVRVTGPAGLTTALPCFWRADPDGTGWRARFTPPLAGRWQVVASDGVDVSPPHYVDVDDDGARGFVRVAGGGFRFDQGEPFFPIGPNLAWSTAVTPQGVLDDYERWLGELARNGCTATRVWLAPWSFGLEWTDTGLGDYTARMDRAWLLDKVFEIAERHGIAIMLTLLNHGQFSATTDAQWSENPYNIDNGGPLAGPEDFVTEPTALELYARRLRYIGARWAAQPALWAWEWWNEANWTPIPDDALAAWIRLMTPVLRAADPYTHPLTTSYGSEVETSVWDLDDLDFACVHLYSAADATRILPGLAAAERKRAQGKPVVLAEYGVGGVPDDPTLDPTGERLHQGLWAGAFAGFASAGMYWWWDSYLDLCDLWWRHRGLAAFLAGEQPAALVPAVAAATGGLTALTLTGADRVLGWIRGPSTGGTVTLPGLPDGAYTARWHATTDGAEVRAEQVVAVDGTVRLVVPELHADVAVRLTRLL